MSEALHDEYREAERALREASDALLPSLNRALEGRAIEPRTENKATGVRLRPFSGVLENTYRFVTAAERESWGLAEGLEPWTSFEATLKLQFENHGASPVTILSDYITLSMWRTDSNGERVEVRSKYRQISAPRPDDEVIPLQQIRLGPGEVSRPMKYAGELELPDEFELEDGYFLCITYVAVGVGECEERVEILTDEEMTARGVSILYSGGTKVDQLVRQAGDAVPDVEGSRGGQG